jgi:hypothetical protein
MEETIIDNLRDNLVRYEGGESEGDIWKAQIAYKGLRERHLGSLLQSD